MDYEQRSEFKYELYCSCRKKALFLLEKALVFARTHGREDYQQYKIFREVAVTGARYMHRDITVPV